MWKLSYLKFMDLLSFLESQSDTVPPEVLDCPSNPVIVPSNFNSTRVYWPEPYARDDSGLPVIAKSSHASGDVFLLGSTLVKYIFEDIFGNVAGCEFVIVVESK